MYSAEAPAARAAPDTPAVQEEEELEQHDSGDENDKPLSAAKKEKKKAVGKSAKGKGASKVRGVSGWQVVEGRRGERASINADSVGRGVADGSI